MTRDSEEGSELVFLDACCLINLFATGRAEEILVALPYRFAVARYVLEQEALEIGTAEASGTSDAGESRVALRPLIDDLLDKGIMDELDITSKGEETELVRFAADLDDGEAHTCALAIVRGARVATDDRKAIRVLSSAWKDQGRHGDPVMTTSELLFAWADGRDIAEPELIGLVRAVARRASFFPPRRDRHFERWMKLLQQEP